MINFLSLHCFQTSLIYKYIIEARTFFALKPRITIRKAAATKMNARIKPASRMSTVTGVFNAGYCEGKPSLLPRSKKPIARMSMNFILKLAII